MIGVALVSAAAGVALIAAWSTGEPSVASSRISNGDAITIRKDWQGTPIDQYGRFMNHEFPFTSSIWDLIRWKAGGNPQRTEKAEDKFRLAVRDPSEFLRSERDGILWMGHATFFIRLNGKSILLDPVFGKPPLVSIYADIPNPLGELTSVDYILTSHDHRDHTDEASIRAIVRKFPNAILLAGLGAEDIFNEWKTPSNEVKTIGRFQQFTLPDDGLKIYFLPVRHWSRRGLLDTNQRLWGAFVIESEGTTIYFSGDSGYGGHYRETGELFPEIDYFIVGIGGYKPEWFMEPNHDSPTEAVQAFLDAGAKTLIPMHFGRFDLSDEPPGEPLRLLYESAAKAGVSGNIRLLQNNESLNITQDKGHQ